MPAAVEDRCRSMRIEELLHEPGRRHRAAVQEIDALTEPDTRQEVSLVAVGWIAVTSHAALLLDCLDLPAAGGPGTRGPIDDRPMGPRHGARHGIPARRLSANDEDCGVAPSRCAGRSDRAAESTLAGAAAQFYVGDRPRGDDPPPDFLRASAAQIPAGLPDWSSTFDVVHAVFSR